MSKEERKACVKELRAVARELDVSQIRDDSGRSKVQEWFQSVVRAATSKKKADLKDPLRCAESFDNFDTTSSDSSETP